MRVRTGRFEELRSGETGYSVNPRRALMGLHPRPGPLQVLSRQDCRQQSQPRPRRFVTRAAGFVASRIRQGFTLAVPGPPRSRGLLTHGRPHRHGVGYSSSFGPSFTGNTRSLLGPRLTSRSGSTPSPFQAQGEISPGKNALLHCTTAGFTPLPLGHESFAVIGPLALVGSASSPVLVHRYAVAIHASFLRSVTLPQLRFTSLAVASSRRDFLPLECAHAGRTKEKRPRIAPGALSIVQAVWNDGLSRCSAPACGAGRRRGCRPARRPSRTNRRCPRLPSLRPLRVP